MYPSELKTCPQKNLHIEVYSNFIPNGPNSESTKTSFRRWTDKLWYTQWKVTYCIIPTIWLSGKDKTVETVKKKIIGWQELGEKGLSTIEFWGSETILHDTTVVDMWHYAFVKTHRICNTKRGPDIHCGTEWYYVCQCRFISPDGRTNHSAMFIVGGEDGGRQGYGNTVHSAQFCFEPKTALKNTVY